VRWKVWWRQSNIKCEVREEYASCWVHQDCHVADEEKKTCRKAAGVSGGKDEYQMRLKGTECDYWMDTEISMLRGYGFQGQVAAGGGSDKKRKMGAMMKRGLQVFEDKRAHSGDHMKDGVKVTT